MDAFWKMVDNNSDAIWPIVGVLLGAIVGFVGTWINSLITFGREQERIDKEKLHKAYVDWISTASRATRSISEMFRLRYFHEIKKEEKASPLYFKSVDNNYEIMEKCEYIFNYIIVFDSDDEQCYKLNDIANIIQEKTEEFSRELDLMSRGEEIDSGIFVGKLKKFENSTIDLIVSLSKSLRVKNTFRVSI